MTGIEKAELKELLNKCWMTHDAMWFLHALQECGIETTNRINRAAIRDASKIEIKRIMKALGVAKVESFEEVEELVTQAFALIKPEFMEFECTVPEANVIHWKVNRCFAHDGIQKMGVIAQYECGIFERLKGWFDALGVPYRISPEGDGCMMHAEGRCFRDFRVNFGD